LLIDDVDIEVDAKVIDDAGDDTITYVSAEYAWVYELKAKDKAKIKAKADNILVYFFISFI